MTAPADHQRIIELRFPLRGKGPFDWIEDVDEFLMGLFQIDDGEDDFDAQGHPEYVFSLTNADDSTLLGVASCVAAWPFAPVGTYCLVPGEDGSTTRVDLPLNDADRQRWCVVPHDAHPGSQQWNFNPELSPIAHALAERFEAENAELGELGNTDVTIALFCRQITEALEALAQIEMESDAWPGQLVASR